MTTYILTGSTVHGVRTKGSWGFVTTCGVLVAGKIDYVKVEQKNGLPTPTRGWLCAECAEKEGK